MKNSNEPLDKETILLTLDQLSQTVEVMEHVINKLRRYINKSTPTSTTDRQPLNKTLNKADVDSKDDRPLMTQKKSLIH